MKKRIVKKREGKFNKSKEYTPVRTYKGYIFIPTDRCYGDIDVRYYFEDDAGIWTEAVWTNTGLILRLESRSAAPTFIKYLWEYKIHRIDENYPGKEMILLYDDKGEITGIEIQINKIPASKIVSALRKKKNNWPHRAVKEHRDYFDLMYDLFNEICNDPGYQSLNRSLICDEAIDYDDYTEDAEVIDCEEIFHYYQE